jgi:thiol-disulfide isomerase/thioredoxin
VNINYLLPTIVFDNLIYMKVLKIGAVWCSGCTVMRPRWRAIEEDNPWLLTEYYEYDESEDIVEKYNIESATLPVFIFLDKEDKEFARLDGEVSKEKILEILEANKDR